jgi:transposase-like protein
MNQTESNTMKKTITSNAAISTGIDPSEMVQSAWEDVGSSFDRFCLTAGIASLTEMMAEDAERLCGGRHERGSGRRGHRWGTSRGMAAYHGGKVPVERPRVRGRDGKEIALPSWREARDLGLLEQWAVNLMLINVSTRKYGRAVRLPQGDVPGPKGAGLSKSAVSRRFKALTEAKLEDWMSSDLSGLDLLVIQIDGMHLAEDLLMIGAVGVDARGDKHPLGVVEGATENTAVVQALLDNLIDRGLDPELCRLFVVDGAKALTKAIRRTFGADIPIQRCQVHKARNIVDRLPAHLHASVRRTLRQAWELDDAQKAERLLRNLARRLDLEAPGVAGSILEGLDEILTVTRLELPLELRRSLACTNMIESMNSVIRQVCRNVKRWRNARMALRWTGAAMLEAKKGFRRLKAHKQLPALKAALEKHRAKSRAEGGVDAKAKAA